MTRWKALKIRVNRGYIDPLSGFLYPRGCVGISYDEIKTDEADLVPELSADGVTDVTAYFPFKSDAREIARDLGEFMSGLPRIDGNYAVDSIEVEDFGWADKWKEFFRPIKIGATVTVTPSWEKGGLPSEGTTLIIDPGEAFGTGSHETTRLCIELIEQEFARSLPGKCLDIGCGTGILGILMAKLGAREVLGVDIDMKAVEAANKNSRVNSTESTFRAITRPVSMIGEKFDFLSANIIAETLVSMKDDISSLLGNSGRAILSGILIDKSDWVRGEFKKIGFHVANSAFLGTWSAVALKKDW